MNAVRAVRNRAWLWLACTGLFLVSAVVHAAVPGADNTWVTQGPMPAQSGQVEGITDFEVVGAVHAIAAHPTDADILYIGAVNGGVWKTADASSASPLWSPLTDTQQSLSISALEFDPTDGTHQTLVAGIGRYSSYGGRGGLRTGLLKTTNAGTAWSVIDGGLAGKNISGLAPRGATIVASVNFADVFSCANVGIFRSTDGGTTFTQVPPGAGIPTGVAYDLASDRSSATTLYTAMVFGTLCSALPNGVYRSTDSGASWAKVSDASMDALITDSTTNNVEIAADGTDVYVDIIQNGRPVGIFHSGDGAASWTSMDLPRTPVSGPIAITAPGFLSPDTPILINTGVTPHGLKTRTEIVVSGVVGTSGANGLWTVSVVDDFNFTLDGSSDATAWTAGTGTWTKVVGMNPGFKPGSQGGTHASIVIDPDDPDSVFIGGDRQDLPFPSYIGAFNFTGRLFRGDPTVTATGAIPSPQWQHLTHSDAVAGIPGGGTANGSAPHADSRELVFDADGNLIEADDGGIYRRTSPADNTGDWFSIIGNLQVTEMHDVAFDSVSDIIISGNQDTGTTQQKTPGSLVWDSIHTGDGGDVSVDDITTVGFSTRFSSFQNASSFRRRVYDPANVLQSQLFPTRLVTAPDEEPIYPFLTPVELNAVTPTRLVIAGCNAFYESANQGDTLQQIDGLFDSMCAGGGILGGVQNAIAYGGVSGGVDNEEILYVGSFDNINSISTIWVRTAADPNPLVQLVNYPATGQVEDIVLDPDDWKTVYAIEGAKVYRSIDTGASWTDITGNLSDTLLHSAAFIPGSPDILVVGGRTGMYFLDLSALPVTVWSAYGTGLPKAPVWDMSYEASDDALVVGTLGRGAWKLDTVDPSGPEFQSDPAPNSTLAFGDQLIDTESAAIPVKVDNLGDANLTLACAISGTNDTQFILKTCATPVTPAAFTNIEVSCMPTSIGAKTATLNVTTNDVDESTADYPLTCNGSDEPLPELIFEDGFEIP